MSNAVADENDNGVFPCCVSKSQRAGVLFPFRLASTSRMNSSPYATPNTLRVVL